MPKQDNPRHTWMAVVWSERYAICALSAVVSQVAKIPAVRRALVAQQQAMGQEKGIVMDGRDIGTVVFPEPVILLTAFSQKNIVEKAKDSGV